MDSEMPTVEEIITETLISNRDALVTVIGCAAVIALILMFVLVFVNSSSSPVKSSLTQPRPHHDQACPPGFKNMKIHCLADNTTVPIMVNGKATCPGRYTLRDGKCVGPSATKPFLACPSGEEAHRGMCYGACPTGMIIDPKQRSSCISQVDKGANVAAKAHAQMSADMAKARVPTQAKAVKKADAAVPPGIAKIQSAFAKVHAASAKTPAAFAKPTKTAIGKLSTKPIGPIIKTPTPFVRPVSVVSQLPLQDSATLARPVVATPVPST